MLVLIGLILFQFNINGEKLYKQSGVIAFFKMTTGVKSNDTTVLSSESLQTKSCCCQSISTSVS